MKTIIQNIVIAFIVISILLSLPYILKERDFKTYGDEQIRKTAISKGLKPIPNTYEDMIKVMDKKENPITREKIALGKELFFDTKLSKNSDISCATCHLISKNQEEKKIILNSITQKKKPNDMKNANNCVVCHLGDESGTDRLSTSIGDGGKENPHHLNTMTILNSSLAKFFTWGGEIKNIEGQIAESIQAPTQMNMKKEELVKRLSEDNSYKELFNIAFKDPDSITFENINKSIATYVRTLLTRSSFDKFLEGDNNAINPQAKQGLINFMNFGCSGCHTGMSVGGQSVQRFPLRHFAAIHDLRPNLGPAPDFEIIDNSFPFNNIGNYKGRANTHFFRVPILRNITKTSPYFHNGSVDKIKKAVEIMGRHQLGLNLTNKQIDEIVAFLKTLEGNIVDYSSEGSSK
ncbi:cytochrome-c peroxidase [Arcobacter sp. LA11]|uniref:cytochrome-c peroxidase n=1 Tax=Arcobacter sp. LA11 TaxID=1898176 RepID=UPI000ADE1AC7|nr:cytochrome c peroxidase [Arcobacter sp. LA11]